MLFARKQVFQRICVFRERVACRPQLCDTLHNYCLMKSHKFVMQTYYRKTVCVINDGIILLHNTILQQICSSIKNIVTTVRTVHFHVLKTDLV